MLLALLAAACSGGGDGSGAGAGRGPAGRQGTGREASASLGERRGPDRPRGGSARVGVWASPDPAATTLGGAAVRALVLPQLFVALPDGRWAASLAVPGSDRTAGDGRSATLKLRRGAVWSDGAPITADDLRRSMDARFVSGVDGPAADGTVTLRFTQPLPGWRRLWSGTDSVPPPRPGLWGGPFVVAGHTPGLEAVLRRNERWYVPGRPFLDEVRLVLVPDPNIARVLLERGELDAVMPPASTVRTAQLDAIPGVSTAAVARGGWWTGLLLRPDALSLERRRALIATVDRRAFVGTLLHGEAVVLDGFASPEDARWAGVGPGPAGALAGAVVDLVGEIEEPMTPLLQRSMQKRAHPAGGRLELRNAESGRVERWVAEGAYQAAVVMQFDGPEPCWTCRWQAVDEALARAADAGDRTAAATLEDELRDRALLLPLWRPRTVVAWRSGLNGVRANGYALSAAWNAWEWWRGG